MLAASVYDDYRVGRFTIPLCSFLTFPIRFANSDEKGPITQSTLFIN